jgi:hypothetical protein
MDTQHTEQSGDRHRSRFMVRVPEIFRTKLQLLREKTGRPMTSLVQWALKMLLRGFGLWTKEDDKELAREQPGHGQIPEGEAT